MASNKKMLEKRPPFKFNFTYQEAFSGLLQQAKYRYFYHFVSGPAFLTISPSSDHKTGSRRGKINFKGVLKLKYVISHIDTSNSRQTAFNSTHHIILVHPSQGQFPNFIREMPFTAEELASATSKSWSSSWHRLEICEDCEL